MRREARLRHKNAKEVLEHQLLHMSPMSLLIEREIKEELDEIRERQQIQDDACPSLEKDAATIATIPQKLT